MNKTNKITGYPSIDKPWLKYYSYEAINMQLPEMTMYGYVYENNKNYLGDIALSYFGRKITYKSLFNRIEMIAKSFQAIGIGEGDIVTIMSLHTPEIIYCIYALNRLGAIASMVYVTLSDNELKKKLKDTDSKTIVVLENVLEKVLKIRSDTNIKSIIVVSVIDSMPFIKKTLYKLQNKKI